MRSLGPHKLSNTQLQIFLFLAVKRPNRPLRTRETILKKGGFYLIEVVNAKCFSRTAEVHLKDDVAVCCSF